MIRCVSRKAIFRGKMMGLAIGGLATYKQSAVSRIKKIAD
jgi:hypothetical protein